MTASMARLLSRRGTLKLAGLLDDLLEIGAWQVVAHDGRAHHPRDGAGRALADDLRLGVAAAPQEVGDAAQQVAHVHVDAPQVGQPLDENRDGGHAGCQEQPHERTAFLNKISHRRKPAPGGWSPNASGKYPMEKIIRRARGAGKRKNCGGNVAGGQARAATNRQAGAGGGCRCRLPVAGCRLRLLAGCQLPVCQLPIVGDGSQRRSQGFWAPCELPATGNRQPATGNRQPAAPHIPGMT